MAKKQRIKGDFDDVVAHVQHYLTQTGQCFAPYATKTNDPEAIAMRMMFGAAANNGTSMGVRKACEQHFGTKFIKPKNPDKLKLAA